MSVVFKLSHNGGEQTLLADLGLANPTISHATQAAGVMRLRHLDQTVVDVDPLFAYWDTLDLYQITDGGEPVRVFSGRVTSNPRQGAPDSEGAQYVVQDAWYEMSITTFKQTWNNYGYNNGVVTGPVVNYVSHVCLNREVTGGVLDVKEQLTEIIAWAAFAGISIQAGFLDGDGLVIPTSDGSNLDCAAAIQRQLLYMPSAVTWIDYNTTPPTLNIRKRETLSASSVTYPGNVLSIGEITDRSDRKPPCVSLTYNRADTYNGNAVNTTYFDKWPTTATGHEPGTLTAELDLQGIASNTQTAEITTEAVNLASSAFWKARVPHLDGTDVTILNITGATRTSALGYLLTSGTPPPWLSGFEADTIRATIWYKRGTDAVQSEAVTVKAVATYRASNTYTRTSYSDYGEAPPVGLARTMYEELYVTEWDGEVTIKEQDITAFNWLGRVVNIIGGRTEWLTMRGLVSSVDYDLENGETSIRFGAPRHLTLGDRQALSRANRAWRQFPARSQRETGGYSGALDVQSGKETPKENGSGGGQMPALLTIADTRTPPVGWNDELSAATDSYRGGGKAVFDVNALKGKQAAWKEVAATNLTTGEAGFVQVMASAFYSASVGSHLFDIGGSGGGGIVRRFKLVEVQEKVYKCNPLDPVGDETLESIVYVARPPLQQSPTSETFDDVTVAYTGYTANYTQRNAAFSTLYATTSEIQVLVPHFQKPASANVIYAATVTTGLTAGGQPVGLMDINVEGRAWARKYYA